MCAETILHFRSQWPWPLTLIWKVLTSPSFSSAVNERQCKASDRQANNTKMTHIAGEMYPMISVRIGRGLFFVGLPIQFKVCANKKIFKFSSQCPLLLTFRPQMCWYFHCILRLFCRDSGQTDGVQHLMRPAIGRVTWATHWWQCLAASSMSFWQCNAANVCDWTAVL